MMAIAVRLLIFVAVVYLGLCAIIYFRQDRFIYPAPRTAYDPAPGYAAVQLTTADGLTLAAHWRAPDTDRPVVVHFHGNGGSLDGAMNENRVFADRGFGVLLVEYRGYGGNPGSPGEAGFYADGRAAMAFLQNRAIPMDRTILKGHSIGTGTATQLAQEFSPAALILLAPFTSIKDRVADALPFVPVRALLHTDFDNAAKLPALRMPVLIQHGDRDEVIPLSHAEALSGAGPHVTYQRFDGSGHDLTFEPSVQKAQLDWLIDQGIAGDSLADREPAPDAGLDAR